jgi:asparagine synthase (glutamine-hydrolysing)
MCGIIGAYGKKADQITEKQIRLALKKINHRGPDSKNHICEPNLILGHTRLSIIDTRSIANQPMKSDDGDLTIVFNGEIYNYPEIKQDLISKGHKFNTESDTEVILKSYKEYGHRCTERFIGMWAFAIHDKKSESLFLSRDRIGEKPLYYTIYEDTIYFSSELPALLDIRNVRKEIDFESLTYYLTYNIRHMPWDKSIFKDVRKVPPAHNLFFKGGKINLQRYWKPDFNKKSKSKKSYLEEYENILGRAVKRTCISDVPVGILLSGGVDSSTIAMLLEKKNITSYTIGFDKQDPELKRAKKVAERVGIKNKQILFSNNELLTKGPELFRDLISNLGEPVNLLQPLYTYMIMKEVKKDGLKVLIGGNGADEIFYGYDGANKTLLASYLFKLNDAIPLFKFLKLSKLFKGKWHVWFKMLELNNDKRKPYLYTAQSKKTIELFGDRHRKSLKKTNFSRLLEEIGTECNSQSFIEHAQWLGLTVENEHSITIVGDLGGMAQSIEIRTPFLDKELMEFGFRLPLRFKVRSLFSKKGNKWIMRKFLEQKMGSDFLYGKKMGFGYNIKLKDIISKHWNEDFKKVVFKYIPETGIFNMEIIEKMYEEHMQGADHSTPLFGIYTFGIWHKIMMEQRN